MTWHCIMVSYIKLHISSSIYVLRVGRAPPAGGNKEIITLLPPTGVLRTMTTYNYGTMWFCFACFCALKRKSYRAHCASKHKCSHGCISCHHLMSAQGCKDGIEATFGVWIRKFDRREIVKCMNWWWEHVCLFAPSQSACSPPPLPKYMCTRGCS
jgi:hypothetical protein